MCRECRGVWLEPATFEVLSADRMRRRALTRLSPERLTRTRLACPRCGDTLSSGTLWGSSIEAERCTKCEGMWLSSGKLTRLVREQRPVEARDDAPAPEREASRPADEPAGPGDATEPLPALRPLKVRPLGRAAIGSLFALYAICFAGFTLLVEAEIIEWPTALALGAGLVLAQCFLGARIFDRALSAVAPLTWAKPGDVPEPLVEFIATTTRGAGLRFPRVGILEDPAPNAFAYGVTHSGARIVLTRGLLDSLDEKELRAVVAHEIGHLANGDFVYMTLGQILPFFCYLVFRFFSRAERGHAQDGVLLCGIAAVSFFGYLLLQSLVLALSRRRELWADRFSVHVTRDPGGLTSALVKIATGMASDRRSGSAGRLRHRGLQALGIVDPVEARVLALHAAQTPRGKLSPQALAWDVSSRWTSLFALGSTHPSLVRRLRAIAGHATELGFMPPIAFEAAPRRQRLAAFLAELVVATLPIFAAIGMAGVAWLSYPIRFEDVVGRFVILGLCLGKLAKLVVTHRTRRRAKRTIAELLASPTASPVVGRPVTLRGRMHANGIPGILGTKDVVLEDGTGRILVDHGERLSIANRLFGIASMKRLHNRDIVIEGWFRRDPLPTIEIGRVRTSDGIRRCRRHAARVALWSAASVAAALSLLFL